MTKKVTLPIVGIQRTLIVLSLIALLISFFSTFFTTQSHTNFDHGPEFLAVLIIPICITIGAMGLAVTARSVQPSKHTNITTVTRYAKWQAAYYAVVMVVPFVITFVVAA